MNTRTFLSVTLALLVPALCFPQTRDQNEHLLARVSYRNSFPTEAGDTSQVCIAVYESGLYRLSRVEAINNDRLNPPVIQGSLSREELDQFRGLLHNLRSNRRPDGIVRKGVELFVAEAAIEGKSVRYTWVDADHSDPFPRPISKVVYWLKNFKPKDSTVVALHELSSIPRPCPALNESPFQPVIAELGRNGPSCSGR